MELVPERTGMRNLQEQSTAQSVWQAHFLPGSAFQGQNEAENLAQLSSASTREAKLRPSSFNTQIPTWCCRQLIILLKRCPCPFPCSWELLCTHPESPCPCHLTQQTKLYIYFYIYVYKLIYKYWLWNRGGSICTHSPSSLSSSVQVGFELVLQILNIGADRAFAFLPSCLLCSHRITTSAMRQQGRSNINQSVRRREGPKPGQTSVCISPAYPPFFCKGWHNLFFFLNYFYYFYFSIIISIIHNNCRARH